MLILEEICSAIYWRTALDFQILFILNDLHISGFTQNIVNNTVKIFQKQVFNYVIDSEFSHLKKYFKIIQNIQYKKEKVLFIINKSNSYHNKLAFNQIIIWTEYESKAKINLIIINLSI